MHRFIKLLIHLGNTCVHMKHISSNTQRASLSAVNNDKKNNSNLTTHSNSLTDHIVHTQVIHYVYTITIKESIT